jgi:hypothetical protein
MCVKLDLGITPAPSDKTEELLGEPPIAEEILIEAQAGIGIKTDCRPGVCCLTE